MALQESLLKLSEGVEDFESFIERVPTNGLRRPQTDKPCVVLFFNGTFCPPHKGHLDALCSASECLESHGYEVLGGYLSPCSTHYAVCKLGASRIETSHRIELC